MSSLRKRIISCFLAAMIVMTAMVIATPKAQADTYSGYLWPVPSGNRALSRGYTSSHSGIDIAVGKGTAVYATKAGTVYYVYTGCNSYNAASTSNSVSCSSSTCSPNTGNFYSYTNGSKSYKTCNWGYGNGVVLKHSDGTYSMYAHMTTVSVSKGASVYQGQQIGTSGSSGNSTGAHLHFELSAGMSMSGTYAKPSSIINNNPKYASYQITSSNKTNLSTSNGYVFNSSGVEYVFSTTPVPECETYGCSTSAAGYYKCTAPNVLVMHNAHNYSDSSDIHNNIPAGTIVWMQKAATLNGATYAHVVYNGIEGIASKNFLELVPSYTLSFNANGGSGGPGSVKVWANVGDYYAVSVPYRDNYTFNGWYTAASGGTQVYNSNGVCTNEGSWWRNNVYVGGRSATLYAQWTINTVYVTGVTLNPDYADLTVGDELQITATVSPSNATYKTLSWVSGDTSVATVNSSGKVTAVAPGSAVVSAASTDGSGKWGMCVVNVFPHADDLLLNRHSMYLSLEEPFTQTRLTAIPTPDVEPEYLSWSSSDFSVVTVDENGLLTAQGEGRATITVSIVNGPSDSCVVRVVPSLKTFVVPDGTVALEDGALEHTGAEAVILPQGLETLGARALADNASLRFVLLPDGVTDIAPDAFADDPYLTLVVGAGRDMSAFDMPYVTNEDASIVTARRITLPANMTIHEGEQKTLTPVITPVSTTNKGVTWTSSDPAVAVVNASGLVTGVSIGTATITATTVDGTNLSASCTVSVIMPQVTVTPMNEQITVSDNNAEIYAELDVAGVPDTYSVEWYGIEIYDIADTLIARSTRWANVHFLASNVTGEPLTPSTVYGVRYLASVGGYVFRSERTDFTTAEAIPRIELAPKTLTLSVSQIGTIVATILNHDPDDIIWRTSNSSVASVVDGEVIGLKAGTATITARLANDTSVSATCTVTVD